MDAVDAAGRGRELQRIAERSSAKKKHKDSTPGSKLRRARLVTRISGTGCIQKETSGNRDDRAAQCVIGRKELPRQSRIIIA